MKVRTRATVAGIAALAVLAAVVVYVARTGGPKLPLPLALRTCTVRADGEVTLDPGQMANAATIVAVGVRRKMPERATQVALATALQESKLRNLTGGDRDSVGLFQQRPSQGWGTPEQIMDPRYSARKFYQALRKVPGWEQMKITDAAQRVQRSAYPKAYEKWADEAAVLAQALLGDVTGAVSCAVPSDPALTGDAASAAVRESLRLDWGRLDVINPAGLAGVAVSAGDARTGWRYAHWLVSHAANTGVKRVRLGGQEWTAKAGRWSEVDAAGVPNQVVAEVFGAA